MPDHFEFSPADKTMLDGIALGVLDEGFAEVGCRAVGYSTGVVNYMIAAGEALQRLGEDDDSEA